MFGEGKGSSRSSDLQAVDLQREGAKGGLGFVCLYKTFRWRNDFNCIAWKTLLDF